jgi:hypothetical protein
LFIAANAWGVYDTRSFSATIQRAGWPPGIRVYAVRHAVAFTIRRRSGDARDVQEQLGHVSLAMADHYYGADPERQQAVATLLEGRLGAGAFAPLPRSASTKGAGRESRGKENVRKFQTANRKADSVSPRASKQKPA